MIGSLVSIKAIVVCLSAFTATPAGAQSTTAPTWQDEVSQHHQLQYRMMNEMTQQMTRITEQMSRGALSPEENKKMGEQMGRMAKMMQFMSGLASRPAHTHAQVQKQMDPDACADERDDEEFADGAGRPIVIPVFCLRSAARRDDPLQQVRGTAQIGCRQGHCDQPGHDRRHAQGADQRSKAALLSGAR